VFIQRGIQNSDQKLNIGLRNICCVIVHDWHTASYVWAC
jgi:hypothetical protein